MVDESFNRMVIYLIILVLLVLSFFLLKPLLLSITIGIILAFLFTPLYDWVHKITKSRNLSASLICFFLILLIVLPIWFFTPILLNQSIKIYQASQQIDFVTPLKDIFPSLFASQKFSEEAGSVIFSFVTKMTNFIVNAISEIIINFPQIMLQVFVIIIVFFFVLRDKEYFVEYIRSLLPFPKEVEKKLFESSAAITNSVLYGQVFVGILQGLIAGLGFFIFKVPNALFLTILACIAGIIPLVGPFVIWVPVVIFLLVSGNNSSTLGVLIFGIFASTIDNILRPLIVSKKTKMHSSVVIVGMIGGLVFFGILGIILGPLIISYLLIILETYRKKDSPESILQKQ